MNPIEVSSVSKAYGGTRALADVSLSVRPGEVFGLLGPDGAGKTTLFHILTTLMLPDSGTAAVCGLDCATQMWPIRRRVGYMPGRFSLYPDLTVRENLEFFASLFGVDVDSNYSMVEPVYRMLKPFESRPAGKLSGGMKQKLALSCALIHRPDVLLLDEPTTGVDAVSRREFWQLLADIKRAGITVLVSTPYMDEAARCDRVALMNAGRIMASGTLAGLLAGFSGNLYAVPATTDAYTTLRRLRDLPQVRSAYLFGESIHVCADTTPPGGSPIAPGIEDLFIQLIENARD